MRELMLAPISLTLRSSRPRVILYTGPDCSPAWPTMDATLAVSSAPCAGGSGDGLFLLDPAEEVTLAIRSIAGFTLCARAIAFPWPWMCMEKIRWVFQQKW